MKMITNLRSEKAPHFVYTRIFKGIEAKAGFIGKNPINEECPGIVSDTRAIMKKNC